MADADWAKYVRLRGQDLPGVIQLRGKTLQLARTFKHDFYAVTGLYQLRSPRSQSPSEQVVLKRYHTDRFWILPLRWLGRWLCRREIALGRALQEIDGIPRLLERFGESGLVREFVPGCNLRELAAPTGPDDRFFPRLRGILAAVHRRGIAHCDLSKPENVLVRADGRPMLIDFQIAFFPTSKFPGLRWLARRFLHYLQQVDRYHLQKTHRRFRPADFTPEAREASRRKGLLLTVHGWIRRPYRAVRHFLLRHFLLAR